MYIYVCIFIKKNVLVFRLNILKYYIVGKYFIVIFKKGKNLIFVFNLKMKIELFFNM